MFITRGVEVDAGCVCVKIYRWYIVPLSRRLIDPINRHSHRQSVHGLYKLFHNTRRHAPTERMFISAQLCVRITAVSMRVSA